MKTSLMMSQASWRRVFRSSATGACVAAVLFSVLLAAVSAAEYSDSFFVAPDGDDGNPGTLELPLKTLEAARQKIRDLKSGPGIGPDGAAVILRGGDYLRTSSLVLSSLDGGEADRPVVWKAHPGETVRWLGAEVLESGWFVPVSSGDPEWTRLPEIARGEVWVADLSSHGITDYGELRFRGNGDRVTGAIELFADEIPMQLARWPDADQHEGLQTGLESHLTLFGDPSPDVAGGWTATGTRDGVNSYTRDQLVGGLTYHLYRMTWLYEGNWYTAWFIAAQDGGYPGDDHPWWSLYSEDLGSFNPSNGASGNPTTLDPKAVTWGFAAIDSALSNTEFTVRTDRLGRWSGAEDPWFFGFWRYFWAENHVAAASINAGARTVTLQDEPGYGIADGMPWFAENLLEEISRPGEWYVSRSTGKLYWWPPAAIGDLEIMVSMLEDPVLLVDGAESLRFIGLSIGMGRGDAARVHGGSDVIFDLCRFVGAGNDGVRLEGTNHSVLRSEVVDAGDNGIWLKGGDRPSLAAGNILVENTEIHRFGRWTWTYAPGIHLWGTGNTARHNHIHDAPHSAILFRGNNHLMEYNEINDVCLFASDAGAIYAGRRWDWRGNRIISNYIHDIDGPFPGAGEHAVYLDDCMSGVEVFGNLIVDVSGQAIMHGGGRDSLHQNNIAVRCGTMLWSDARGYDWINNSLGDSWNLRERLHDDGVAYQVEPWCSTWPELCAIPDDWSAISAEGTLWRSPENSVFSRNLGWENFRFMVDSLWGGHSAFDTFSEIADNLEDTDPLFRNEAVGDYRLREDSPALTIPGFVDIPFAMMGILDGRTIVFNDDFEWADTEAWGLQVP